jgi:Ca2+-transporting ATPase
MTLGIEPSRPGTMNDAPRTPGASILSWQRMWRIALFGLTMAVGTLAVYSWSLQQSPGDTARAGTLAFTTFVLFQFFNIFNARAEFGSTFNRQFFANGKLWLALAAVVGLQVLVVNWGPAQTIFDTVSLSLTEWGLATLVASSALFLEELRKLVMRLVGGRGATQDLPAR